MRQKHFYLYQVATGNIARIVNNIGQYEMKLDFLKKTEEEKLKEDKKHKTDKVVKSDMDTIKIELIKLEELKDMYVRAKDDVITKYFKKYK